MIKGVEIIEIIGSVIHYKYKDCEFYNTMTDFEKMTKEDLDLELQKSELFFTEIEDIKKRLPPPNNADFAIFERWQSETGFDD